MKQEIERIRAALETDTSKDVAMILMREELTAVLSHIDQQAAEIERLRAVIVRSQNVMQGGEGVEDQGEAWDLTVRILETAIKETP